MPIRLDPEENETAALFDYAGDLAGQRVLEIGCGDGRLTWRYADQAAHVIALDPNPDDIALAIDHCPLRLQGRVEFRLGALHELAASLASEAHPPGFDLAILSWSL